MPAGEVKLRVEEKQGLVSCPRTRPVLGLAMFPNRIWARSGRPAAMQVSPLFHTSTVSFSPSRDECRNQKVPVSCNGKVDASQQLVIYVSATHLVFFRHKRFPYSTSSCVESY